MVQCGSHVTIHCALSQCESHTPQGIFFICKTRIIQGRVHLTIPYMSQTRACQIHVPICDFANFYM